jgi:hypothetical protein
MGVLDLGGVGCFQWQRQFWAGGCVLTQLGTQNKVRPKWVVACTFRA